MNNDTKHAAAEEKVCYVEALASAEEYPVGDYWLTLTDAARVTKRQDKTIRDWVQQGKLPVRPVHLGVNKRTRQVRASDLAKITPIVDQTAAITSEAGQIYLASIPGEMQQIHSDHGRLLHEHTQLQQEIQRQGETLHQDLDELKHQQQHDLTTLDQRWHQEQGQARTEIHETFTALDAKLAEQQRQQEQARAELHEVVTALEGTLADQQERQRQAMDTLNTTWQQRLDRAEESRQTEVQRLDQRVDAHQQEIHQLAGNAERLETALHALEQTQEQDWAALRQELATTVSQQERARRQSQHELQQAIQVAEQRSQRALEEHLEQMRMAVDQQQQVMSHRLTQLEQGAARRQREQEQQLQHLRSELAGQQQAMEGFAAQLLELEQGQQRMLEQLQQQIEQLARRQQKTK